MKNNLIIIVCITILIFIYCSDNNENKTDKNTVKKSQQKQNIKQRPDISKVKKSTKNKISDFTLNDLITNKPVKLSDSIGDKPVILNFWAEWCPPCKKEIPDLIKLSKNEKNNLKIISVATGGRGKKEQVKKALLSLIKKYKINYPVLWDSDNKIGMKYRISSIPTTFVVDKDGEIVEKIIGARPYNYFLKSAKKANK